MAQVAILDIDGTLVDSNFHHTLAWDRALRAHDLFIPLATIHRHIGMGGDKIVQAIAGEQAERDVGDAVREAENDRYLALIGEVRVLPGARELVDALLAREKTVVLASSAKADEVDAYLDLLDVRDLVHGWTTSADVEATKPAPDLVEVALEKAGSREAVLVGDTTWDCKAAASAGIASIAVRTGGFGEDELRAAGAAMVLDSAVELAGRLEKSPLR